MKFSVVICCYNSEHRICPTLHHLEKQDIDGVDWEIIIVDNNCKDRTIQVAEACWNHSDISLRIVKELIPGLSAARERGVAEAKGVYVLFCDDDNWLSQDYLRLALAFMETHPDYAAIGGWGDVVSDSNVEIPEWFDIYKTKYACGKTREEGDVDTLVGAAMFIRKKALIGLASAGFKSLLSDRKGVALSSGGDFELSMALRIAGWKLYFSEAMSFMHYMPEGRLTKAYLLRMCHGHGRSRPILSEYQRLISKKGHSVQWSLRMLPMRVIIRYLKFRLFKVPTMRRRLTLAEKVLFATNEGAAEAERELIATGKVWKLSSLIAANLKIRK